MTFHLAHSTSLCASSQPNKLKASTSLSAEHFKVTTIPVLRISSLNCLDAEHSQPNVTSQCFKISCSKMHNNLYNPVIVLAQVFSLQISSPYLHER